VFAISSIGKKLLEKLQRKPYRHAYLAEHVRRGIAYQIRALRDQRKWKQGKFAEMLGKPQSVACRLEDPDYGKVTIQTLLEVANVFDVALEVRFVRYSTFISNTRDVSVVSMRVPEFNDDLGLAAQQNKKIANRLTLAALEPTAASAIQDAETVSIVDWPRRLDFNAVSATSHLQDLLALKDYTGVSAAIQTELLNSCVIADYAGVTAAPAEAYHA